MKQQPDSTHGYLKLCYAIINSGVRCNDVDFLNSEWYEFLKSSVDDLNGANNVVIEDVIPKLCGNINSTL